MRPYLHGSQIIDRLAIELATRAPLLHGSQIIDRLAVELAARAPLPARVAGRYIHVPAPKPAAAAGRYPPKR